MKTRERFRLASIAIALLLSCVAAPAQDRAGYSIVPAESTIEINVYKEGLLKAFGHDHLIAARQISGQVQFDPGKVENSAVSLTVETKSLAVMDQGISEKDRQDVQATMSGVKVLDAAKYPQIVFRSTAVSAVKSTPDGWNLALAGTLELHGVEKPISLPIALHLQGGQIRAEGEVSLLQTDYGITPVKGGGGAVAVKDKLKISFDIVAAKSAR